MTQSTATAKLQRLEADLAKVRTYVGAKVFDEAICAPAVKP